MGGWEKIKFPKENRDQREKKTAIRADQGKQNKSTWDGKGIEKRILSVHHPSTLVHWWVLVHSGCKIANGG